MTITVQQLIDLGHAIQDPNDADRIILNIPISVAKAAIAVGALEGFAKARGWEETIDGQPNPVPVFEGARLGVAKYLEEVMDYVVRSAQVEQANAEADAIMGGLK